MLFIIDARMPEEARKKLHRYGDLLELKTEGLTYPAISGHPDIFFTQIENRIVVAPNLPEKYHETLDRHNIVRKIGEKPAGTHYPASATYNAAIVENLIIHNFQITDKGILNELPEARRIHVSQGYTRCNLVFLNSRMAVTSDRGIYNKLCKIDIETLYADPAEIKLPGFRHGFFGGTCGTDGRHFFILGSLSKIKQGPEIASFIDKAGLLTIELCNTPLIDGGSIFCLEK